MANSVSCLKSPEKAAIQMSWEVACERQMEPCSCRIVPVQVEP